MQNIETGSGEHRTDYKEREVKRLTEKAWEHMISAAHLRDTLPKLDVIRAKGVEDMEAKKTARAALNQHGKQDREQRHKLDDDIKRAEKGLAYVDARIEQINKQAAENDQSAQMHLARAQFIEDHFPALLDTAPAVEPEAEGEKPIATLE